MKVMGSSLFILEAIVIGLAMPVAIVNYGYSKHDVLIAGFGLIVLCILTVGGLRRDRRTALFTGSIMQGIVIAKGMAIHPFLVPGIIFAIVWVLAINLSDKVDRAKALK